MTGDDHEAIIEDLTLEEKLAFVHGDVDPDGVAVGYLPGIDRHDVPAMSMVDGPMGVRSVPATAFPASISLASAWDPELAREFGRALASEARGAGQDAVLGPGFNVVRVPQCGRNFEYYSEDPYLASRVAVGTVEGIQDEDVIATAKHYVANNQETDRHYVSAEVSERALREIYLPAFEAAVTEAEVGSVMAAYNRVDGTYATEHEWLLTDVLKGEWDFSGFVVSDWWATMDGPAAAEAGLDLDMPGLPIYDWHFSTHPGFDFVGQLPTFLPRRKLARLAEKDWQPPNRNPNVLDDSPFDEPLREAVEAGDVDEAVLDEKVRRILGQLDRFGVGSGDRPAGRIDAAEHDDLAREIAIRGTVCLRNQDDVLPLAEDEDVAMVGPHVDEAKVGGGGSSEVEPTRAVSPLDGVRERASGDVTMARGIEAVGDASLHGGVRPDLPVSLRSGPRMADAMDVAEVTDVAVVVVRDRSTEGADRDLGLPGEQDQLIRSIAAAAEQTVVVLRTAGMVEMPWAEDVDAILQAWYPGQADGTALARVLYGDRDPSGRLPVTFGTGADQYPPSSPAEYPGDGREVEYAEGVFVGYRHFDAEAITPRYPFGHGLSYARFTYGDLAVDVDDGPTATAEVTVTNESDREGREVVQAYLGVEDSDVPRPPRELAAFEAVALDAGEATRVTLDVDRRDFAVYDEAAGEWVVPAADYSLAVGRSSRDRRVRADLDV